MPLTPQNVLSTPRNMTRTIVTYHYDHWSTETYTEKHMQAEESSYATENINRSKRELKPNLHEQRNW